MPIKGVIWYQGESNIRDGSRYTAKLQTLASHWRSMWDIGNFPFYFVQIAPFDNPGDFPFKLPELWEAQTAALKLIPRSGMVVINDVGNIENVHPRNKAPVGERLARLALHDTYGESSIVPSGPMLRSAESNGEHIRVAFDHVGSGLVSRDGQPLTWFEVAGNDQIFVSATAVIEKDTVLVHAPSVSDPVWVRFAWHETAEPNLMNAEGLPANSFRISIEQDHSE